MNYIQHSANISQCSGLKTGTMYLFCDQSLSDVMFDVGYCRVADVITFMFSLILKLVYVWSTVYSIVSSNRLLQ